MEAHRHAPDLYLADTLRRMRKARGWSLDRAAQATGVSKAMLGQIERGESSPTVATLWKIAGGFDASLSSFLEPPPAERCGTVFRDAGRLRRQPAADGMLVATLFPFEPRFGFELFELTLLPGYERESEPHEAGVIEHVLMVEGRMEMRLEGEWIALDEGQALRFAADRPHGYRNSGKVPAVFHNLICYAPRTQPGGTLDP